MRRNKKIWKKVMAAVLLMIMCLQMVIPSRAENEEIIFIRTAADLVELSEKCKSDSWSIGKVVVLENDISLKEVEYSPIPYFAGTFNGQGYTISDLEGNGRFYPAGLFGIVAKEGIVQNLEVTGALLPEGENGCVGGIAGYSSGFINDCSNNKTVGYPKVGYNIGGIAGWNNGYICECNNNGSVYGRKDVGGIVGQAEPYVAVEISKSKPAILERQVLGLENQMDSLSACMGDLYESVEESKDVISPHFSDVRAKVTELKNLLSKQNGQLIEDGKLLEDILKKVDKKLENVDVEATGIEESLGGLEHVLDKIEQETSAEATEVRKSMSKVREILDELEMFDKIDNLQNFQADATKLMNELSESMENIDKELENMDGNVSGLTGQIHDDVKDIQNQLKLISNTGKDILSESEGEVITEISKEDIAEATYGKIEKSTNYALIEGDLNVGGITGIMSVEYETNPEEELSSEISWREQKSFELKTVLFECTNKGEITANKDAAGGICGWMDVGIISSCYSYGPVTSVSGGYVGGIAGITRSTITDCIANNRLSGKCYVGGIAGSRFESSEGNSKINNNYSMVEIIDCQQFEGAIAGKDLGEFELWR